jgi:hypothetical protein
MSRGHDLVQKPHIKLGMRGYTLKLAPARFEEAINTLPSLVCFVIVSFLAFFDVLLLSSVLIHAFLRAALLCYSNLQDQTC